MKRKIIIAASVFIILVIVAIPLIVNFGNNSSNLMNWGKADRNIDGKGVDFIASDKITLTSDFIDAAYTKCSTTDDAGSFKRALMYQLKRRALYQKAIDLGYTITDEEVWSKVNQAKEWAANASNRNELDTYIAGLEMTWDEYWNSQFEDYKISWLPSKYYDNLRNEYFNGDPSSYYFDQEKADAYDTYVDQIKIAALAEYGVTEAYVDEIVALYADGIPTDKALKKFAKKHKLEAAIETLPEVTLAPETLAP